MAVEIIEKYEATGEERNLQVVKNIMKRECTRIEKI